MSDSYARTETASVTSASNSDDAVTPPTEQAVGDALRLKRWLEHNDTMEKRTDQVFFANILSCGLTFTLILSCLVTTGLTAGFVASWSRRPEFEATVRGLSWEGVIAVAQNVLRAGVLFLLDNVILPQVPLLLALAFVPLVLRWAYSVIGVHTALLCSAYSFGLLTLPCPFTGPAPFKRVWDAALVPLVAWRLLVLVEPLAPLATLSLYANTLILYLAGTAYFDVHPLARRLDLAVELEQGFRTGRLGKGGDAAAEQSKDDEAGGKLRQLEAEVAFLKTQLA
ncbi:hypothetical protein JCM10296v2_006335 [Rhodotorula toruloides]